MSSKSSQIYTIKLSDWVLADSTFSKKASTYVPISRAFLNAKSTDFLSVGEKWLMISLVEVAYNLGRSTIEVNPKFYRSQGKALEKSLLKLSDFGYLDILINKEINELSSSKEPTNEDPKKEEKLKQHFFEKFVFDVLDTADTGICRYATKVDKAFINEIGFNAWVVTVTSSPAFKKIQAKEDKQRYFLSALNNELKNRGAL